MAGQQPRTPRFQTVSTFFFGASRPTSSISIHQPQRPTRQSPNAFLQLRFSRRENTRCIFGSIQNHRFRLGRPIPSRCKSYYNLQQDNSFHSGASRPTSPAALLLIPAHNPQQANSLPPGLAGRRLTFLPTTFLISTKHHLPTKYRSPPFFQNPPITIFPKHLPAASPSSFQTSLRIIQLIFLFPFFHFLYCVQHPPGLHLFVPPTPISSHHFPNSLHFFRPAAASPTRRPNAKRSFARGGSLQGCRWCGRGARVSFFFLFLFFSASLFSLFFSISLAPRLRRDAFIFLFTFVLIFVFSFFLFAFIFAFFFLLFSIYFSSDFLFLFFLCSFFLLFLSFYFCSYLCFFVFLFLFLFYFYLCLLYFFSLFFFLVFIFASPFLFCLSFCFTFLPSSLQFLSLLSNRSPAIRFFSPAANFSHPIQPLPAAAKRKKISAKESTGVRWPSGSERATEGKVEGQDGMN